MVASGEQDHDVTSWMIPLAGWDGCFDSWMKISSGWRVHYSSSRLVPHIPASQYKIHEIPCLTPAVSHTGCLAYWLSHILAVSHTVCLTYWLSHIPTVSSNQWNGRQLYTCLTYRHTRAVMLVTVRSHNGQRDGRYESTTILRQLGQ